MDLSKVMSPFMYDSNCIKLATLSHSHIYLYIVFVHFYTQKDFLMHKYKSPASSVLKQILKNDSEGS